MEDITLKFQKIYSDLKVEKGDFYVFMILKMDEFVNKWSVVVSAPWITKKSRDRDFEYIVNKFKDSFSPEESATIARLGIFQPDEHLIKLINQSIRVSTPTPIKLEETKLNGYLIHEAYIFESNPPQGSAVKAMTQAGGE